MNETKDHYFSDPGLEIVLPERPPLLLSTYRPYYLTCVLLATAAIQLFLLLVLLVTR